MLINGSVKFLDRIATIDAAYNEEAETDVTFRALYLPILDKNRGALSENTDFILLLQKKYTLAHEFTMFSVAASSYLVPMSSLAKDGTRSSCSAPSALSSRLY